MQLIAWLLGSFRFQIIANLLLCFTNLLFRRQIEMNEFVFFDGSLKRLPPLRIRYYLWLLIDVYAWIDLLVASKWGLQLLSDCLVKESPPLRIRKANLDRILSPRTVRKSYATASPAEMTREKSLSPVQAGSAQPLSTSMSNASIHSNYSDDSLMAAFSSNAQRFNSPSSRWNNLNLNNSAHTAAVDCYNSLPCG